MNPIFITMVSKLEYLPLDCGHFLFFCVVIINNSFLKCIHKIHQHSFWFRYSYVSCSELWKRFRQFKTAACAILFQSLQSLWKHVPALCYEKQWTTPETTSLSWISTHLPQFPLAGLVCFAIQFSTHAYKLNSNPCYLLQKKEASSFG
jgi:hypothetical protein